MTTKEEYLNGITTDKFLEWVSQRAFTAFATSSGSYGHAELGVDGNGNFVVKHWDKTEWHYHSFGEASQAIDKYKEIII